MRRGRPSKKFLSKYSFENSQLDKIDEYFYSNLVQEQVKEQDQVQEQEQTQEKEQEKTQVQVQEQEQTQVQEQEKKQVNLLKLDAQKLQKMDIIASAILEGVLNFVGIKKEIDIITSDEASALCEIMPPVEFKKSWGSFFVAYLSLKILK